MFTGDSQLRSRIGPHAAGSSNLRPRVARLISGLDDDDASGELAYTDHERSVSFFESTTPAPPRSFSPLPSRHPSRTNPSDRTRSSNSSLRGQRNVSSGVFGGLLGSSWSTVQGFTSTFWGGGPDSVPSSPSRQPRPKGGLQVRTESSGDTVKWGSTAYKTVSGIGAGSTQEREAMVREMKRRDMLSADAVASTDNLGKHKRRQSDDVSRIVPTGDPDEDALVYIHNVRATDTVAGLSIRYGCPQAIISKTNRLWTNDSIQSRKTLLIPVGVCTVKGTPVPSGWPSEPPPDLLGDDDMDIMMHESPVSSSPQLVNPDHFYDNPSQTPSVTASTIEPRDDPAWTHDSWVRLPNSEDRIEVGRLPQGQLGFFPRARRKSNGLMSGFSTPKPSIDIARSVASSAKASPAIRPQPNRPRSVSRSTRGQAFPSFLHGPGGIGTLDKSATPGPALDPLNEIIAPHLYNVKPPPSQTAFTPWNPGLSSAAYAMSAGQDTQPSMDLLEISNAIETWIRKTAKKATGAFDNAPSSVPATSQGGDSAGGDLIELVDSIDLDMPADSGSQYAANGRTDLGYTPHNGMIYASAQRDAGLRGRRLQSSKHEGDSIGRGD